MLLLRDEPLIQNLKSNYIKIEKLMLEMKEKKLTGFVEVDLKSNKDILIYRSGKVVKVFKINSGLHIIDKSSVVFDLVKVDAIFSVYRMKEDFIKIILYFIENEPLYKNLTTEFINLKKLMRKLQKDEFSGIVYMSWNDEHEGAILMESGLPSASVYKKGNLIEKGADALESLLQESEDKIANVDVITDKKRSM